MLQLLFVSSVCIQSNARYVFVYSLPVPSSSIEDRNKSRLYLGRLLLLILCISYYSGRLAISIEPSVFQIISACLLPLVADLY